MNTKAQLSSYVSLSALCILLSLSVFSANAQQSSNIWLGKLALGKQSQITELTAITANPEYSNQPYFFDSTQLYFTQEVKVGEQSQMDIFVYNGRDKSTKNLTQSSQSEYSATPMPGRKGFSVIRVNAQGKQELWAINASGDAREHLASAIEPVGYQVWVNKQEVLLFVLGEPHTLQRVSAFDSPAQTDHAPAPAPAEIIDSNIGASLVRFETSNWFLYSQGNEQKQLKAYNSQSRKTISVVDLPTGSEYFSVSPTGHVFTSDGKTLWQQKLIIKGERIKGMEGWQAIKINEPACQSGISRTAISSFGDRIALVCNG